MDEFERLSQGLQIVQVPPLDLGRVETIQIIKAPDRVARLQQTFTNMRTNKTCPACDEKFHSLAARISPKSAENVKPTRNACRIGISHRDVPGRVQRPERTQGCSRQLQVEPLNAAAD